MNYGTPKNTPKKLEFDESARRKLIMGINKVGNAVGSTLGPMGHTVIIESQDHLRGMTVTKDGVTVARAIDLMDPIENIAARMVKEAANRTANQAGDATSTSIVLTQALVQAGSEILSQGVDRASVIRHINQIKDKVIERLKTMSTPVDEKDLLHVATISANNDEQIGQIIASVYEQVGRDGLVTVDNSQTPETHVEITDGIKIDKGYSHPRFVNKHDKDTCEYDKALVLLTDVEISHVSQIEKVMAYAVRNGMPLVMVAPTTKQFEYAIAMNVIKQGYKFCIVPPPNFGYAQAEIMDDIALATGGKFFSEKTGDDLTLMEPEDLGRVGKVVIERDKTVFVRSLEGVSEEDAEKINSDVEQRIEELKSALKIAKNKRDKDLIEQRIASLRGGIGVIYVGGNSDIEQKELYDRIEDAVCSARSALEMGVLPGSGLALYSMIGKIPMETDSNDELLALSCMDSMMEAPLNKILENAGLDIDQIYAQEHDTNLPKRGYDVKSRQYVTMIEAGIVDPTKAVISALENAVSVATTILSTNAIITMAREVEK